jgi:hypothetical protein
MGAKDIFKVCRMSVVEVGFTFTLAFSRPSKMTGLKHVIVSKYSQASEAHVNKPSDSKICSIFVGKFLILPAYGNGVHRFRRLLIRNWMSRSRFPVSYQLVFKSLPLTNELIFRHLKSAQGTLNA